MSVLSYGASNVGNVAIGAAAHAPTKPRLAQIDSCLERMTIGKADYLAKRREYQARIRRLQEHGGSGALEATTPPRRHPTSTAQTTGASFGSVACA